MKTLEGSSLLADEETEAQRSKGTKLSRVTHLWVVDLGHKPWPSVLRMGSSPVKWFLIPDPLVSIESTMPSYYWSPSSAFFSWIWSHFAVSYMFNNSGLSLGHHKGHVGEALDSIIFLWRVVIFNYLVCLNSNFKLGLPSGGPPLEAWWLCPWQPSGWCWNLSSVYFILAGWLAVFLRVCIEGSAKIWAKFICRSYGLLSVTLFFMGFPSSLFSWCTHFFFLVL